MCQQYVDFADKMKKNLKTYQDKLKMFLKVSLKAIPFFSDLKENTIEELTYHLKQKYYEPSEIIVRAGDPVDDIHLITRGEVDLILSIHNQEFVAHNLFQGCYLGGYKILKECSHSHTARAVNSVTIHTLCKDSISLLQKNFPDFNYAIEMAKKDLRKTEFPVVGFGLFRDPSGNLTPIRLLKMAVVKILKLNRDLKDRDISDPVSKILERMQIDYYNEAEEESKPENFNKASLKLMKRLSK